MKIVTQAEDSRKMGHLWAIGLDRHIVFYYNCR
jgi:hypothetical protein